MTDIQDTNLLAVRWKASGNHICTEGGILLGAMVNLDLAAEAVGSHNAVVRDDINSLMMMDFSTALRLCKNGRKITRTGWNGKNQWVAYSPGFTVGAGQIFSDAVRDHVGEGTAVFAAYLVIHNAQGVFVPWLASQGDLLADDWVDCS